MIPTARSLSSGEAEAKRMIEFAKLHVEAALKAASETPNTGVYSLTLYDRNSDDKKRILNSYDLNQIK